MCSSSPPPRALREANLLIVPVIAKSIASRTVLLPEPFLPFSTTNPLGRSKRTFSLKPRKPQSSTKLIFIPAPRGDGRPPPQAHARRARTWQHSAQSSQSVFAGAPSDPRSRPPPGIEAAAPARGRRRFPLSRGCRRQQSFACVPDFLLS